MIKMFILIIIGVLILSFFGITIQSIVQSPTGQANFDYLWSIVLMGWDWLVAFINTNAAQLQKVVS